MKGAFLVKMLLRKRGSSVKIRKATTHYDSDRGTDYTTYDDTISTRALITNVSGWMEIMYPYGRAYEGDYLALFNIGEDLDINDRILYDDKEFKISEVNNREDFIEAIIVRV